MRYAYFPGCVSEGAASENDMATRALCKALGIELEHLAGAACCGSRQMRVANPELNLVLNARTFAQAEQMGLDILVICSTCQLTMNECNKALKADKEKLARVNQVLAQIGMRYRGTIEVKHLLWILLTDYGIERLKRLVVRPLNGLKVAPYYGCHLLRPVEMLGFDDPNNPTSLDILISALGGVSLHDFATKAVCCGFHALLVDEPNVVKMIAYNVNEAKDREADCLITPCPLCHVSLDGWQPQATGHIKDKKADLPVTHLAQLIGLAIGLDPKELKLSQHMVETRGLLGKVGVAG